MNDRDREVLAVVAHLNRDMGHIVLALTAATLDSGRLPPKKLRELAVICDNLSALVDNLADEIDPPRGRRPLVVPAVP